MRIWRPKKCDEARVAVRNNASQLCSRSSNFLSCWQAMSRFHLDLTLPRGYIDAMDLGRLRRLPFLIDQIFSSTKAIHGSLSLVFFVTTRTLRITVTGTCIVLSDSSHQLLIPRYRRFALDIRQLETPSHCLDSLTTTRPSSNVRESS